jgi:hypothetical protein
MGTSVSPCPEVTPKPGKPAAEGGQARDGIAPFPDCPQLSKQMRSARSRRGDRHPAERAGYARTRAARANGRAEAERRSPRPVHHAERDSWARRETAVRPFRVAQAVAPFLCADPVYFG